MTRIDELTSEDLGTIVGDIWMSLFEFSPDERFEHEIAGSRVRAHVDILGGDGARVLVEMTAEAAAHLASHMHGIGLAEVSDHDVLDAVGEMANMVGGSVKACLGMEYDLSLPHSQVTDGEPLPCAGCLHYDAEAFGEPLSFCVAIG